MTASLWPDDYIIIIIQSLAIYNNDDFPISIKMPKLVRKFAKYKSIQKFPNGV